MNTMDGFNPRKIMSHLGMIIMIIPHIVEHIPSPMCTGWSFPRMVVPQNGWFTREIQIEMIEMDD